MARRKRAKQQLLKIGKKTVKSKFEHEVYNQLRELLPRGAQVDYESERLPYTIRHEYLPDFVIRTKTGKKIYIEAKGNGRQFDGSVRQKLIAARDQNDIDLRIVFYADGAIGPKRKNGTRRRQSDWAQENKFIFAVTKIPTEWFSE
jgi:hypothetical protein